MAKEYEYRINVPILFRGKTKEKALEILKWNAKFAATNNEDNLSLGNLLDNIDVNDVVWTGVNTK